MVKFKVSKLKSTMEMSVWEYKLIKDKAGTVTGKEVVNKAIMEIAPSLENAPKGPPKAGEKRYDYEKKVKISFNPTDMLKAAYALTMMSYGNELEYKKMGDASKANANSSGVKSLSIKLNDKGSVAINLSEDNGGNKKNVFIYLDKDEAYALAKWFEATYNKLYNAPGEDSSDNTNEVAEEND